MSKFCGKRSLCPVGREHAEACARAAWRAHSAACKAPDPSPERPLNTALLLIAVAGRGELL